MNLEQNKGVKMNQGSKYRIICQRLSEALTNTGMFLFKYFLFDVITLFGQENMEIHMRLLAISPPN